MSPVIPLAIKDLKLLVRDPMGMFFIIVFPILMGLFFGVINKSFASEPPKPIDVGIVDDDRSSYSARFISLLEKDEGVNLQKVERREAAEMVRNRKLLAYIILPKGFGETAGIMWASAPRIDIGIDPSRSAEGALLQGRIMQSMGRLVQDRFADPESMRAQVRKTAQATRNDPTIPATTRLALATFFTALDQFLGAIADSSQELDDEQVAGSAPQMQLADIHLENVQAELTERGKVLSRVRSPWDISFPSAMMWGIFGCVAGFATSMVRERTEGTLLRLNVAPIRRWQVLGGKGLACFASSSGVVVVMTLLGFALGLQVNSLLLLTVAIVCVSLSMVGLMMLMSVLGKTEQSVAGAGWAIIVVASMFGGGMIPLAFMPEWMLPLSSISPAKWAILALEGAIWRGFTFQQMLIPCGILLAIGMASFIAGLSILSRVRE